MHFNTKYIFKGESESEIIDKINSNFNQILFFAVGPNGQKGPKGPVGFPGPAGKKGVTGPTGQRATVFTKQDIAPSTGGAAPYDYWIDSTSSDYSIYSYGITGGSDWVYSGYSLFSSPYFDIFDNIIGPGGANEKNAIGFKSGAGYLVDNGLTVSDASLVISDNVLNSVSANPNRSKLVIATSDQTSRPILSFAKTGASNTGIPSFYWLDPGNSTNLTFSSSGSFQISSLLGLTVDSFTASSILNGNSINLLSPGNITIGGTGDFYLISNTTVGVGSDFLINSSTLSLTSTTLSFIGPLKITNTSRTSGYVLDTTKNSTASISSSGIEIYSGSGTSSMYDFLDSNNASILSTKVKGVVSSSSYGQTNFGSTGGLTAGGTAGPYFYHVKRAVEYRQSTYALLCSGAPSSSSTVASALASGTINNIFDLSSAASWTSDTVIVTPQSFTSSSTSVYLKIPSSPADTLSGLYYAGTSNTYKIVLNDISPLPTYTLAGLVLDYYQYSGGSSSAFTYPIYIPFSSGSSCYQVELFFMPAANNVNANPRIFWKTCDGKSGFVTTTNRYTVGTVTLSGTTISGSA
jgi:hypothetical protein